MERLQQIYDDAGAPGAQAFMFAARRKGVQISEIEAKAFVVSLKRRALANRSLGSRRTVGGARSRLPRASARSGVFHSEGGVGARQHLSPLRGLTPT